MGEVIAFPGRPLRGWLVFPDGELWGARKIGFGGEAEAYPPSEALVTFGCIMSIIREHDVRMGLPIIVNPLATALGGAA
ncbi:MULTISPECIES: hypothetical protein [Sphingobium]|uniref:hypothetical protein n=1 Tax=Sphingobium TaxID=165695 RepID=UPI0011A62843|nr:MULTISPECIES: hypothetical protein [Sphingobium]KAA9019278.1 hypothetical protein F4U94_03870 [Sphingobium limneticum]